MKRVDNIYPHIYSLPNLALADSKARKGKRGQYGIAVFDRNPNENLIALHHMLKDKTYRTSAYTTITVHEPKERLVHRLPYFPDRITHHAIMNPLENIFVRSFTADTYSCIKGRGILSCFIKLQSALRNDVKGTKYYLQMDVKKFYQSINHALLKQQLIRKFKDADMLWLLHEIIDSAPGLPIGNYLSQFLANFHLSPFDHWMKEVVRAPYYYRYCDDMVVLGGCKSWLHNVHARAKEYLAKLMLAVKGVVRPVAECGINFLGYITFENAVAYIRPGMKRRFARMLFRKPNAQSISSYLGWCKYGNCNNLLNTLLPVRI